MEPIVARVASRYLSANRLEVGKTIEVGSVRMHAYVHNIKVTELTNAGKRGKRCRVLRIVPQNERQVPILCKMVEDYKTLDSIRSTINDYLADYPGEIRLDEEEERGVDVVPAGFKPIEIRGEHVIVEVGMKDFVVRDRVDTNNLPTCIPASKGGIAMIPTFYRWVKDNESRIEKMKYYDVLREMKNLGIKYHDFCAMD